ncbi:hypothetical protein COO60DRAFT_874381 [Scenedesmus sp. NREL 46B-D3]|nr:hypothetical protein COO60DRAFT_874381 [Scenedesmus sp. NREL 46B-D3]
MDGLVWANSSISASAYSMTNVDYHSRSRWPSGHHHHHSAQPHPSPSTDSSAGAAPAATSSSSSSSSNAMLRHQRTSSPSAATLGVAIVQIGSSSSSSSGSSSSTIISSTAAARERLFEPLDAGAGRDYRDQAVQPGNQPVPFPAARPRSLPAATPTNSTYTRARSSSSNANSGGSSSSMQPLQRRHSSGVSGSSFLGSTAGQLLSSLSALGGLSRMGSSPVAGTTRSARGGSSRSQTSVGRVQAPRLLSARPGQHCARSARWCAHMPCRPSDTAAAASPMTTCSHSTSST